MVNQAVGALRLRGRDAGWRRFQSIPPTGGDPVEINVGADESPKMVAKELDCKKISRELVEMDPARRFCTDREKGILISSWEELVCSDSAPAAPPPAITCSRSLQELQMDEAEVRRVTHALFGEQQGT
ncbi:unnamed protein product [Prorocentrum cordatum]|uniref:Uncharacterized protein n=1 Tax=Prorocentrum cordatum TaxID=2364126 RepID=A0ABN9WRZ4_9DINO|nr:unnamed protein product [Polarella glacialis]